jgi:hypothetical protein
MVGGVSILKIISRGHRFLAQSNKGEVRRTVDDVEWKVGAERWRSHTKEIGLIT